MLNVTIICVGRGSDGYLGPAFDEYTARLGRLCSLKIITLPHENLPEKNLSRALIGKALEREGERILAAIPQRSYVIPLCIEGKLLSSEELAALFDRKPSEGYSGFCFIIGSSHGLSPRVKNAGDLKLSFSRMTFTHGMAKLMALEQIYRALSINSGGKYHK